MSLYSFSFHIFCFNLCINGGWFFTHAGLLPPLLGSWVIIMSHPWSWRWIYTHMHETKPPRKSIQQNSILDTPLTLAPSAIERLQASLWRGWIFSQKSRALIVLFIFFLPLRKHFFEKVQSISVVPEMRQSAALQLLYSQHKKSTSVPMFYRQEIFLLATDTPYSSSVAELCPPPEICSGPKSLTLQAQLL